MRDAIGWGALGAGGCAALVFALGHWPGAPAPVAEGDATEAAAPAAKPGEIAVGHALAARIGLKTATASALTTRGNIHGFARGLDAGPLAAIEAEIAAARAAAQASTAEALRLTALAAADQSASKQSVEAARAQAAADASRLHLAEQRVALEYGAGLAAMSEAGRRALLSEIAGGRASLVRVDLAGGQGSVVRLANGHGTIRLIGPAAVADPKLQSAGMLGVARGAAAGELNNGRAADIVASGGAAVSGVLVPADAVVRWRGGQWIYRQAKDGSFERVELVDARATDGGWFVPDGIAAGDRVVIAGAGALLALDRAGDVSQESD